MYVGSLPVVVPFFIFILVRFQPPMLAMETRRWMGVPDADVRKRRGYNDGLRQGRAFTQMCLSLWK